MTLIRITAPTSTPVSLAEAKIHLRVEADNTLEDGLITALIQAATDMLDGPNGLLGRALMPQTWKLLLDAFPAGAVKISLVPLISVETIEYNDAAGDAITLDDGQYVVDAGNEPGWVVTGTAGWPASFDAINSAAITFRAGYVGQELDSPPGPNGVPQAIKQAILLIVGNFYANREAVTVGVSASELPMAAQWLLNRYRRPGTWFA